MSRYSMDSITRVTKHRCFDETVISIRNTSIADGVEILKNFSAAREAAAFQRGASRATQTRFEAVESLADEIIRQLMSKRSVLPGDSLQLASNAAYESSISIIDAAVAKYRQEVTS